MPGHTPGHQAIYVSTPSRTAIICGDAAKIDPDTGLQLNEGPSRLRFMTPAVHRNFALSSIQTSISKADARDLDSGSPTPEAPRTIFDLLGTVQKPPLHLEAKGEFELVGRKPLGTGCDPGNLNAECVGTSVKEFRGAWVRPFLNGRVDAGVNFLIAKAAQARPPRTSTLRRRKRLSECVSRHT
jgi:hypothetical protein